MTRNDLAELWRGLEDKLVLSVYLARKSQDPGKGPEWLKRLETALDALRADIEARTPADLPAFEESVGWIMSGLDSFGRVLPHEGWFGIATEERLWRGGGLPFTPHETICWRAGACVAPYVRALKVGRPAVLAVLSQMHATLYRYDGDGLSEPMELHPEGPAAEAADVGISKRASRATGTRGITRTDYAKRAREENMRRHRKELEETIVEMAGQEGVVVLGGTQKAISAVSEDLGEAFAGRVAEVPELAFDTPPEELLRHVRMAASRLTEQRQAELVESWNDPYRSANGWNETYRALAAGAVDTLLVARGMIESSPEDAERLVRLALAQGARVEEAGGEVGDLLGEKCGGVAARLRFVPASLQA